VRTPVRILITGFGPYPGVAWNPSQWLVELLAREPPPGPGAELASAVLPVNWTEAASRACARMAELRPCAILHFGLAPRTRSVAVETRAKNSAAPAPDACGSPPPAPWVAPGGPPQLASTLASPLLAGALRRGNIRTRLSRDAGGYLCNYVFYRSLHWAASQERPPLVGFFHIPPPQSRLDMRALEASGRIIVGYAAALARRRGDRKGR
jgi:pyroglutamyl-peptidase